MTNTKTPLKILYGIQANANGNGHIARARALVPQLRKAGADVHCLFSGRSREEFFDMEVFGNFDVKAGFPIVVENGRANMLKTAFNFKAGQLLKEISDLDVSPFDLVITDFESVTAWAAKRAGKMSIGMGNHYSYHYDIPIAKYSFLTHTFIKNSAPADIYLGLQWHHFGHPILPPLVKPVKLEFPDPDKILVYLSQENLNDVISLFRPFKDKNFFIYSSRVSAASNTGNISLRPLSYDGFHNDLADCGGIICTAGFELSSEAIQFGKKLLVKPLDGVMEQASNALTLERLRLGSAMETLDTKAVAEWLERDDYAKATYPDVAESLATWIMRRDWNNPAPLIQEMWAKTKFSP